MNTATIWWIIVAVAIGGLILRGIFIVVPLLPRNLSPRLQLLLSLVPAAAFAALVAPALALDDDGQLQLISPASLAGAAALALSLLTKSLALSILGGLAAYGLLDLVM
jgi:branched-subunit amino acid transport protein